MDAKRLIEATCPQCNGPLSEVVENGVLEYRCLVEHRFSPISLLAAHSDKQERALWAAVLALEEADELARVLSLRLPDAASTLRAQGEEKKRRQAVQIRDVLEELKPFTVE